MFRYTKILEKAQNSLRDSQIETATVFQWKRILKNLLQQVVGRNFFFILKQTSTFFVLPEIGKMFRVKSPVLMSKLSITPQLSKIIGLNFYQMPVTSAFIFLAILIEIDCSV